jgi:glycosyltransferase involved in cell wall biosynthesis
MRVLFVSYSPVVGGAELILLDFAHGIDGEVVVANPPGPLLARAEATGLSVHPLTERRRQLRASVSDRFLAPLRLLGHAREIRSAVRAEKPDVLVGWGLRSAFAGLAATRYPRGPAFVFQHNDLLPGPAIAVLARAMSRRADAVSALSETIASDLDPRRRLGARLRVVRPGVDLGRFRPTVPPPREPRALLLGAIAAWKRPDLALEIVARAVKDLPGLRLSIVGGALDSEGAALLAQLERRAKQPDLAGRVEFHGWVDDAVRALAEATCLLHCSDREPLGVVLMEALASGRPVVAPDSGGPSEILDDEVGRLYRPGDAEAGARALVAVAQDPAVAERLGAAGRRRAESEFDSRLARERFARLLDGVVAHA